ncbi:MAG: anti-sigma-factor antagonist [Solirubrobacterales bacterium]|nr:anti-sigma-factor antagonist [Solirubrobacterales bacterium]
MYDSSPSAPALLDPGTRPEPFAIVCAHDETSYVLAVHGEFDLAAVDRAHDAFVRALRSPAREIVVDLEFCAFIDSSGVSALLALNRRVNRTVGRDLLILPGPPPVQRVFAVCDLLDVLPFPD